MFDIFDAVDDVLVEVIGKFSNRHIGWGGEIRLVNRGSPGRYLVRLDDIELGSDASGFSNILIGDRRLEITQERPFGRLVIFDNSVEIRENESVTVDFAIPGITSTERVSFEAIWKAVDDSVVAGDKTRAEEHFAAVFDLFKRVESSDELIALRETWTQSFAGLDSEITKRANEIKPAENDAVAEMLPETPTGARQFTTIIFDQRISAGEKYVFRDVEYRRRIFEGYRQFCIDLIDTPGLPLRLIYANREKDRELQALGRRGRNGARTT